MQRNNKIQIYQPVSAVTIDEAEVAFEETVLYLFTMHIVVVWIAN